MNGSITRRLTTGRPPIVVRARSSMVLPLIFAVGLFAMPAALLIPNRVELRCDRARGSCESVDIGVFRTEPIHVSIDELTGADLVTGVDGRGHKAGAAVALTTRHGTVRLSTTTEFHGDGKRAMVQAVRAFIGLNQPTLDVSYGSIVTEAAIPLGIGVFLMLLIVVANPDYRLTFWKDDGRLVIQPSRLGIRGRPREIPIASVARARVIVTKHWNERSPRYRLALILTRGEEVKLNETSSWQGGLDAEAINAAIAPDNA